jgi:hypothetical protein
MNEKTQAKGRELGIKSIKINVIGTKNGYMLFYFQ